MYEFTFLVGETCATPVDPIPIIDDTIAESNEIFKFDIIKNLLPLGVRVSSQASASITILEDNDSNKYNTRIAMRLYVYIAIREHVHI